MTATVPRLKNGDSLHTSGSLEEILGIDERDLGSLVEAGILRPESEVNGLLLFNPRSIVIDLVKLALSSMPEVA